MPTKSDGPTGDRDRRKRQDRPHRALSAFGVSLALGVGATPWASAQAQSPLEALLNQKKEAPYLDSEGRFKMTLPQGWRAEPRPDTHHVVDFWKRQRNGMAIAHLTVEMRTLPPKVSPGHLALQAIEEAKKGAFGFRMLGRDQIKVSGRPAKRTHFTYRERNHVGLTNRVIQVVFIVDERGYVLTMEAAENARQVLVQDLDAMLKTFTASKPEQKLKPPKKKKPKGLINPNRIPY